MALLTAERIYLGERYPTYRNRGEEIDVSSLDLHYRPEIPGDRVISVPAHHSTDVAEGSRPVPAMAGNSSPRIKLAVQSFNLDFLRSVAVLLVIGFHLAKLFNWQFGRLRVTDFGLLGVMLFFVHTTVVLMFSLERQRASSNAPLFLPFMVRRCFRHLSVGDFGGYLRLPIPNSFRSSIRTIRVASTESW